MKVPRIVREVCSTSLWFALAVFIICGMLALLHV